jgi:hypothetical protein
MPAFSAGSLSGLTPSSSSSMQFPEGVPPESLSSARGGGDRGSAAREAGKAFVMRSLTPELEALLRRVCADSPEKPLAADVAQLQAVASKAAIGGPLLVPWLQSWLHDSLGSEATAAVIKTLRLLMDLIVHSGANKANFAARVKADCGGAGGVLQRATAYRPDVLDPQLGEKPATMARKAATQVEALLLGA